MNRHEILLLQLAEIRNELADALTGLEPHHLTAQPIAGFPNPIVWILAHCMVNIDNFIHHAHTGERLMAADGPNGDLYAYARQPPGPENPPPPVDNLAQRVDDVYARSIDIVAGLDDAALDQPAPHWRYDWNETTAANIVRVINHGNAHLREIWLLRGVLGAVHPWPVQNLYRRPESGGGAFYMPDREEILRRRGR